MAFDTEVVRINCDCHGEEVAVGFDPEWPCIDLAFWSAGTPVGATTIDRLRMAVGVFRHGTSYTDMVILDAPEAQKLQDVLNDLIPKLEEAEARAEAT